MSHDIEIREDGTAATINADWQIPWHRLGDVVEAVTVDELWTKVPELGAEVHPAPLYFADGTVVPDRVANIREATARITPDGVTPIPAKYLGTVSDTYRVIQNRAAFDFLTDVLAVADDARITSAGSIRDGRVSWVAVHLADDYLITGDPLERRARYMLFVNSFDASMSFSVVRTHIRVVCNNTLTAAMQTGRVYRVRHTTNAGDRVQEARHVLGTERIAADRLAVMAERMADTSITDAQMAEFMEGLFPTKDPDGMAKEGRGLTLNQNRQAAVMGIYNSHPTIGDKRGTVWGAFNAVTAWDEHVRTAKQETRFRTSVLDGNATSAKAMTLLSRLTHA